MKEMLVISGKGGTGKTSLVASFAALANGKVLADCDVDAADLHLVLEPTVMRRETFTGGKKARILPAQCTACGKCQELCAFDAVRVDVNKDTGQTHRIDPFSCEGCGLCVRFCPGQAIEFKDAASGEWFISRTRFGPMVHARLAPAAENSGKLVTVVRNHAREVAEKEGLGLILVDGAPGIGCPVIASLSGVDLALIVTEPTLSAFHDFERVRRLTRHFEVQTLVCINKHDLNPELTEEIERRARASGTRVAGLIRYDRAVTQAQIVKKSVPEFTDGPVTEDIRAVWEVVSDALG
ncbi:MAG: 4Fe-4S dicluster domain-containing protein [Planctomycetes bacterium]|nr:4Fe-4S dicluster domain-containing protein [Planctomycetota bacterium]MBM4079824.1 4Fe-4S dicluster domain-containing protein [Planctomycetota bacterium]